MEGLIISPFLYGLFAVSELKCRRDFKRQRAPDFKCRRDFQRQRATGFKCRRGFQRQRTTDFKCRRDFKRQQKNSRTTSEIEGDSAGKT